MSNSFKDELKKFFSIDREKQEEYLNHSQRLSGKAEKAAPKPKPSEYEYPEHSLKKKMDDKAISCGNKMFDLAEDESFLNDINKDLCFEILADDRLTKKEKTLFFIQLQLLCTKRYDAILSDWAKLAFETKEGRPGYNKFLQKVTDVRVLDADIAELRTLLSDIIITDRRRKP